jgi:hypothetical protein
MIFCSVNTKLLFFISVFTGFSILIKPVEAVTLYLEDFPSTSNNKGAYGVNSTTQPTIDTAGVNWTVDNISLNDPGKAKLTTSENWFKVRNGAFEAQNTKGPAIWKSPLIDISGYSNISFALDFSASGGLEDSNTPNLDNLDYVDVKYSVDTITGGNTITTNNLISNQNNYSNSSHTLEGNFTSKTIAKTGIVGNNLQIAVTLQDSAFNEQIRFDNVLVEGEVPFDFSPSLGLLIIGGFGSISYFYKRNKLT